MLPRHVVIDILTRVAPLGVRFYDCVANQIVTDLTVTVSPVVNRGRKLSMFPNPSGVYVLHHAPGLRDFEHGAGDADIWSRMPEPQRYIVGISDPRGQFLPFTFEVDIPWKGVFAWGCESVFSSPTMGSGDIPLFSAPRRPIPAGYTAVRADLYDPIADQPAAWALLDVSYGERLLGRGIADTRGCVVVPLAYPPPVDFQPLSPLVTGARLTEQTWRVGIQVWYRPRAPTEQPELCDVLDQLNSPPAQVWQTWDNPPGTDWQTEAEVVYGRELVLRTNEEGSELSRLYIVPAGSPP